MLNNLKVDTSFYHEIFEVIWQTSAPKWEASEYGELPLTKTRSHWSQQPPGTWKLIDEPLDVQYGVVWKLKDVWGRGECSQFNAPCPQICEFSLEESKKFSHYED